MFMKMIQIVLDLVVLLYLVWSESTMILQSKSFPCGPGALSEIVSITVIYKFFQLHCLKCFLSTLEYVSSKTILELCLIFKYADIWNTLSRCTSLRRLYSLYFMRNSRLPIFITVSSVYSNIMLNICFTYMLIHIFHMTKWVTCLTWVFKHRSNIFFLNKCYI